MREATSRFHYQTSASNRNSFWQRSLRSVENVLEHRALIAEGRVAAYSEVMRESVGNVADNQQPYVELGYSESITQTRAAKWTARLLFSSPLAKLSINVAKTAGMMDRWGFFGSGGVKKVFTPEEQFHAALNDSEVYQQIHDINITSSNSAAALRAKLSGLSGAQAIAEIEKILPDGRIRFYEKFRGAGTPGPTAGSRFVTEYNPKTGDVMQWNEAYDQQGLVNRIHLKNINGIQINSPHFPPTLREIIDEDLSSSYMLRSGYQ